LADSFFEREGFDQTAYKNFRDQLEKIAKEKPSEIFEISTNVKGYRSKRDL
jgi:hypothetical protein